MQLTLNAAAGKARKQAGLNKVEGDVKFLAVMRSHAQIYSRSHGSVTTDTLRTIAANINLKPRSPNSWGAIFRGKGWVVIGREPSRLVSNHHREIRVWRWEGEP